MSDEQQSNQAMSEQELDDLVAATDTGARSVPGTVGKAIAATALVWSLFQLWIASPLPFMIGDIIPVFSTYRYTIFPVRRPSRPHPWD